MSGTSVNRTPGTHLLLCLIVLGGCQSATTQVEEEASAIFFPIPPDAPRVQYVTWFSGTDQVVPEKRGGFESFILGEEKTERPIIRKPFGLAARNGVVYAADSRGFCIAKADFKNATFSLFGTQGPGKLKKPINLVVDRLGYKFVADAGRNEVVVFDPDDRFVRAFKVPGDPCRVVDVALRENEVYALNNLGAQIVVMDRSSGKVLRSFGKRGAGDGEFSMPASIAIGPDDHIYVCDPLDFRVQKLTLEGRPVWSKGGAGRQLGTFGRPRGIRVGPDGVLYITDAATAIVQMWDADGNVLMHFGGPGDQPGCMILPANVAIDTETLAYFKDRLHPDFKGRYMVFVANQFGPHKVLAFARGEFPKGYDFTGKEFKTIPIIPPNEEELGPLDDVKEPAPDKGTKKKGAAKGSQSGGS